MSGGSYNYFYLDGAEKLRDVARTLNQMADDCEKRSRLGTPITKHRSTEELPLAALMEVSDILRSLSVRVGGMSRVLDELEDITKAVEWWQSGDTDVSDLVEKWLENRKSPIPPHQESSPPPNAGQELIAAGGGVDLGTDPRQTSQFVAPHVHSYDPFTLTRESVRLVQEDLLRELKTMSWFRGVGIRQDNWGFYLLVFVSDRRGLSAPACFKGVRVVTEIISFTPLTNEEG